ncbi:hypothetical protein DVA67_031705 [Solirubrobacter sp. CPCC 204708]|uniref:DUF4230 domain-containing protein n=1 Tax=Solirubrobacter deserti TaxID=2282478 RepID=A0ABT4RQX0_9ACTN|nr:hypothetical protein [Solirubrobacter deserti]MBE2320568.1 hypothetical protein [Solirubrobacter deserti]MDA0140803.1 hypothetical protein [Solirubrobacter deserti]
MSLKVTAIIGGTVLGAVAVCALILWLLSNGDKAARHASTQFGTALVKTNPTLAPEGAEGYIDGVLGHFGNVASARVIDARNHSVGSGNHSRSYYVADVFLQTANGPTVLELSFDSPSLTYSSERITGIHEVVPRDVRDDALSDAEFVALARAFDRRGGRPATDDVLSGSPVAQPSSVNAVQRAVQPRIKRRVYKHVKKHLPAAPKSTLPPQQRQAMARLKCVQKAKGDIEKLTACAS